jgi:chromosome segregation ATPase
MPRKRTAHDQLDELRQRVAGEGMKLREAQARLEAAKAEVEDRSRSLTDAYAAEDAKVARERREELERAEGEVLDAQHRVSGAELRAQRAREELATFMRDHGRDLLAEREQTAREVAAELTEAVAAVVKARRAYIAERQHVDQLVAAVPGASSRVDGVRTGYSWEVELRALERAYRENPEAELPRPRWAGMTYSRQRDAVHQRLKDQRRKPNAEVVDVVRPPAAG